ncbi:MAG: ATP-binding protein [Alphaproteobacteria bacterium]
MTEAESPPPRAWLRADRLVMTATILLVVCIAALAAGVLSLAQLQEDAAREGGRTRALRAAAFGLTSAVSQVESSQRGYLLSGDTHFLSDFDDGAAEAVKRSADLDTLTQGDAELRPGAEQSIHLAGAAIAQMRADIRLRHGPPPGVAQLHSAVAAAERATDTLDPQADALLAAIEHRADTIRQQNAHARGSLFWLGGVLAVLSLLTAGVAVWSIRSERRSWRSALAVMVAANAEAEISRAKSAASDLAKTRFLAAASHDMRQPLHALTLYLSALERRVEGEEARGILAKAERATQSLVRMFNTLLDLARIQADVVKPEISIFPLQDLIDRVIAEHPEAEIAGPLPPTALEVRSDPVLLERLLRNLVSNAVRHGGGGARISVEQRGVQADIAVIDSGPGIPEEDQERVFEEFVRLDGRAGAEGLGLGLAIVRRIADILGAKLELRSSTGKGATFMLGVPIARMSAPSPAKLVASDRTARGIQILVMDDDPLALEAESAVLRDLGAEVRGCGNETEVQSAIEAGFKPRLLVMDLRIDGVLDGIAIAERAQRRLAPPPRVLMVTGDTAPETLSQLRASGHAWLIKPVSRDDFVAAIASLREEVS